MNIINIDDLPDVVLAEILCRLPSNKLVVQCRCVSKRWCTLISPLISDPYFIGRFLRLQIDKRTPRTSTLINPKGEEILTGMWSPVFKRLMTVYSLKEEPVVVGTYNDLVLCCASKLYQRDYYICNPYTYQWVALPPTPTTPQWNCKVAVGIICDIPYYNYKEIDDLNGHMVHVNAGYRCKVVRIVSPYNFDEKYDSFQLNLEVFSFETGEWRNSILSSPLSLNCTNSHISVAYNGMLYWQGDPSGRLIGLDPFMIINMDSISTTSNGDDITDYYKCGFVDGLIRYIGFCGECLRVCSFNRLSGPCTLHVWDLKEEQDHDRTVLNGTGKFHLKHSRIYPLDSNMLPDQDKMVIELLAFDPNDEDILYLNIGGDIVKCNIHTRKWSKIAKGNNFDHHLFRFVLPWWPTPVPRLPQHTCI